MPSTQSFELPTPWELNSASIEQLNDYEKQHPDTALHEVLGWFNTGRDLINGFVDLIPNEPVPAKALVSLIFQMAKLAQDGHETGRSLLELGRNIVGFVDQVLEIYSKDKKFTQDMWRSLANVKHVIDQIMEWVSKQLNKSGWRRALQSAKINKKISSFNADFDTALQKFIALSQIEIRVVLHSQQDSELLQEKLARNIRSNSYVQHKTCFNDTRVTILKAIEDWVFDTSSSERLFFLTGNPGAGKSTIATTILERLCEVVDGQFFFSRTTDSTELFKTLAFQLSRVNHYASASVCNALRSKSNSFLCERFTYMQVQELFIKPLKSAAESRSHVPILILIDAVDEASSHQNDILGWLATAIKQLPSNVKIFVTSRPEQAIISAFAGIRAEGLVKPYHVRTDGEEAAQDIRTYLESVMKVTVETFNIGRDKLPPDWPGPDRIANLCTQASGLFIWAATAASFIRDQLMLRGTQRIDTVFGLLSTEGMVSIDRLYHEVLELAFGDNGWKESDYTIFRQVISSLIALKQALTLRELENLLALDEGFDLFNLVARLQSLLVLDSKGITDEDTYPRMHPSFVDFITDPSRCADYRFLVKRSTMSMHLAWACLNQLQLLRYNICNIPDFGSHLNVQIVNLKSLIEVHIPRPLSYSCQFFAWHLRSLTFIPDSDVDRLGELHCLFRDFFQSHFLHWMEAVSLLGIYGFLNDALNYAKHQFPQDDNICQLVSDCNLFEKAFQDFIQLSAAHVYISALPFAPRDSLIYKQYQFINESSWWIEVLKGAPVTWTAFSKSSSGLTVHAPRTKQVLQRSPGWNSLQIWDIITGHSVGPPFGPIAFFTSFAWSQDESRVISGSEDGTIQIWDTVTGLAIGSPLEGHNDSVILVAISSNGQHILSCSQDETMKLWDVVTRAVIAQTAGLPRPRLRYQVECLAVSSDTRHVVFGAEKLWLWDIATDSVSTISDIEGSPSHPRLHCLIFSTDGRKVAAGYGNRVYVWDLQVEDTSPMVLECHFTSLINSIEFSPSDTQLAARSERDEFAQFDSLSGHLIQHVLHHQQGRNTTVERSSASITGSETIVVGAPYQWWITRKGDDRLVCCIPRERQHCSIGFGPEADPALDDADMVIAVRGHLPETTSEGGWLMGPMARDRMVIDLFHKALDSWMTRQ